MKRVQHFRPLVAVWKKCGHERTPETTMKHGDGERCLLCFRHYQREYSKSRFRPEPFTPEPAPPRSVPFDYSGRSYSLVPERNRA